MSTKASTPIKTDLLRFYDEFSEFNDCCAFMCDALARTSLKEGYLEGSGAMGASHFCNWMKRRMQELKGELGEIHKKANKQNSGLAESEPKKIKQKRKKLA